MWYYVIKNTLKEVYGEVCYRDHAEEEFTISEGSSLQIFEDSISQISNSRFYWLQEALVRERPFREGSHFVVGEGS